MPVAKLLLDAVFGRLKPQPLGIIGITCIHGMRTYHPSYVHSIIQHHSSSFISISSLLTSFDLLPPAFLSRRSVSSSIYLLFFHLGEESLEVKLPTYGQMQQKKIKINVRNGRKVAEHCVFPMFCGGSKSRLARAVGAEPFGRMSVQKVSAFRCQNVKSPSGSERFWKLSC